MNCIEDTGLPLWRTAGNALRGPLLLSFGLAFLGGYNATASETHRSGQDYRYQVNYRIEPVPAHGVVHVSLELTQASSLLRHVVFRPSERILDVRGDGQVRRTDTEVTWVPPAEGGTLCAGAWTSITAGMKADLMPGWITTGECFERRT